MLRTAAVMSIALSASFAGCLYSKRLEMRVRKLEKILLLLSQIKTAIEFTADSVEGILATLNDTCDFSLLPFAEDCRLKMAKGADFFSAWSEALAARENVFQLKKEDVSLLLSFGAALGATDSAGQMRNCEMHERLFKERLEAAIADKKTLSKPVRVVGFLAGAAVMIIFV